MKFHINTPHNDNINVRVQIMKHMSKAFGGVTAKGALIPLVRILFIQSYLLIMHIGPPNVF